MSGPLEGPARAKPRPADGVDAVDADGVDVAGVQDGVSVSSVSSVYGPHDADLVHAYTRRQALADGVLVDVMEAASPAGMLGGFKVPVAVTAAVWAAVEAIPASLDGLADARGRLHDVLWMARVAAQRLPGQSGGDFEVILPFRGTRKRVQTLRIEVGPDDDGAPCVTIGFPGDF